MEEEQDNICEIDFTDTVNWQEQSVTIDQRAYNQQCKVNVTMIFNIIHSINIRRREKPN